MSTVDLWPWGALLLLGAAHGVNPGMGWLFAVALGLQQQERRAVWRALLPLAAGHALAIGAVALLAAAVGLVIPPGTLKWLVAGILGGFGIFHLVRHRHPRYGGMRVGARDLTIWSFLMASAHGAGIMALPFILGAQVSLADVSAETPTTHAAHAGHVDEGGRLGADPRAAHGSHAEHVDALLAGLPAAQWVGILATLLHTAGYLLVTGLIAVVVYEKLGLRVLRRLWVNLDLVWAIALMATAVLTPLI